MHALLLSQFRTSLSWAYNIYFVFVQVYKLLKYHQALAYLSNFEHRCTVAHTIRILPFAITNTKDSRQFS